MMLVGIYFISTGAKTSEWELVKDTQILFKLSGLATILYGPPTIAGALIHYELLPTAGS